MHPHADKSYTPATILYFENELVLKVRAEDLRYNVFTVDTHRCMHIEQLYCLFLEVNNSFVPKNLFNIQHNKHILQKTTFNKIYLRNDSFASFESTFEFFSIILV